MSLTILCCSVALFYFVIWFFDSFFKSCMHYPYFAFLEGTGLKVGLLHFSWTTTAFNRCIYRWSKNLNRVLLKWFTCGYIITIYLFLPFSLWTLFSLLFQHFNVTLKINSVPEVKALLPGVNIPASDFWVYFLAIALASICHELGHAMAAARSDVQIHGFGVFICTIIPVAFVLLNNEQIQTLTIGKRLRIYCAGVWHNIVLAFIAMLLLFSAPVLFSFAYETDMGVNVVGFTSDSPLAAVRGLEKGDVISAINGCSVKNMKDWLHCVHMAYERYGICTSSEYVSQNDEVMMETIIKDHNVVECCRKDDIYSYCFEYMEPKQGADIALQAQFSCLKPRDMVKDRFEKCSEAKGYSCPRDHHCLKPSMNNHTYLIIIDRKDDSKVLYLGLPYDLIRTVFVDQYFPRINLFSAFSPLQFEKFFRYVFIFSMGIGFLNVIPCYATDGHHIARNLIQILAKYLNKGSDFVSNMTISVVVVGTGITVPTLVYLFYQAIFVDM